MHWKPLLCVSTEISFPGKCRENMQLEGSVERTTSIMRLTVHRTVVHKGVNYEGEQRIRTVDSLL
jgi:hypothetical protein